MTDELRDALATLLAIRTWLIGPDDPSVLEESWRDDLGFSLSAHNAVKEIDKSVFIDGELHPLLSNRS